MSAIPKFFKNAVVALGVTPSATVQNPAWTGTGFLVGRKDGKNPGRSYVYLITNKHVVQRHKKMLMCINKADNSGVLHLPIDLVDSKGIPCYSAHAQPTVDVVAIELNGPVLENVHVQINWFDLDSHALTLARMKETGVDEGCLVYALGFPMGIVESALKAPFLRLGCISRIEDAFSGLGDSSYFVDAQTFPGNSGGPIVSRPENIAIQGTPSNTSANLIGVLNSYLPYKDFLVSRQTGETVMQHQENSGLTRVYPVDRIIEVVDQEFHRIHG